MKGIHVFDTKMNYYFIENGELFDINLKKIGICEINEKKLIINIDNIQTNYIFFDDKYYTIDYLINNDKLITLCFNNIIKKYILKDNMLFSIDDKQNGFVYIYKNILIITWKNLKTYHEKKNDMYYIVNIPKNFDCNYYIDKINNIINYNDWNSAIEHWILNNYNCNCNEGLICEKPKKIVFENDEIELIQINYTHIYAYRQNNDKYYKIKKIENNILILYMIPFIFVNNEVVFDNINILNKFNIFTLENDIYKIN